MQGAALELIQLIPDNHHLFFFAERLLAWLVNDLNRSEEAVPEFVESRARALLRASDLLDDPTRHRFERLMGQEPAVRCALYDLLADSELAEREEVVALAATTAASSLAESPDASWLALAVAVFAAKSDYPLHQLDPATPPSEYSPAGQVLRRAAAFVRQQVQRSATERDKWAKKLAYSAGAAGRRAGTLDDLEANGIQPPLPPHYRSPIPVNYPEMSRETLHVDEEENAIPDVSRGEPIQITRDDVAAVQSPTERRDPIRITAEQTRNQRPAPTQIVTPDATVAPGPAFADSVRKKFARNRESMKATKLRVVVKEYPDGHGIVGLQVRVTCKGIKSHVAGTTTREGNFVCELPVPEQSGLTYDVDVTWPREMSGETERKSITLNADRTEFELPFYRSIKAE